MPHTTVRDGWSGSASKKIELSVAELGFLPPAVELLPRILVLLDDPDSNGEALADLIRTDLGLSADIMQVSNSAAFARGAKTETLQAAIARVGLREVSRVVVRIIASSAFSHPEYRALKPLNLWEHSLLTAVASQVLARHTRVADEEIAFTGGILHDVGKLVLAHMVGPSYGELANQCLITGATLHEAEKHAIHLEHTQAGAALLRQWNLPEPLIAAVEAHHAPREAPRLYSRLAALIFAGNILAHRLSGRSGIPCYATAPDPANLRIIELSTSTLFGLEEEVRFALEQERRRFE